MGKRNAKVLVEMHSERLAAAGAAGDEAEAFEVLRRAAGPELAAELTAAKIDELMEQAGRLRWAAVEDDGVLDKLPPALAPLKEALKDVEARVAEKGGLMKMGARLGAGLLGTLKKEVRMSAQRARREAFARFLIGAG